jgi:hypothetical protein
VVPSLPTEKGDAGPEGTIRPASGPAACGLSCSAARHGTWVLCRPVLGQPAGAVRPHRDIPGGRRAAAVERAGHDHQRAQGVVESARSRSRVRVQSAVRRTGPPKGQPERCTHPITRERSWGPRRSWRCTTLGMYDGCTTQGRSSPRSLDACSRPREVQARAVGTRPDQHHERRHTHAAALQGGPAHPRGVAPSPAGPACHAHPTQGGICNLQRCGQRPLHVRQQLPRAGLPAHPCPPNRSRGKLLLVGPGRGHGPRTTRA